LRHIIYVDDAIISTLKNELQIFWCLCVWPIETQNPSGEQIIHAMQFSHVSFLAH
jgi:hypothetical protein